LIVIFERAYRISYFANPNNATGPAFLKESRMHFANAANLNRKSRGAKWRDLRFSPLV